MEKGWKGKLYCSIILKWNCKKRLFRYFHAKLCTQNWLNIHTSHPNGPKIVHNVAKNPIENLWGRATPSYRKEKKYIQQVLGSFLYCAHTLDLTILHALPAIASEQAKPTKQNLGESVPVIALHDNKPKCSKQIFCFRHDTKSSVRCIILICRRR